MSSLAPGLHLLQHPPGRKAEGWHGQPWGKPLEKTREYVEIVRTALRREVVEHHGAHYDIPYVNGTGLGKPLKLMARPLRADIPIYLAVMGPKAVAQAFEDTGVRAYKGQAGTLQSNDDILTAALQIHSVEARHASAVRRLRGQKGWIVQDDTDIAAVAAVYAGEDNVVQAGVTLTASNAATEAFDEPLSKDAVLAIVAPFIAS